MYPKNPIGKLITNAIKENGISKIDLVRTVGYSNINKGMRKINASMIGEPVYKDFLFDIIKILEVSKQELINAIRETKRIRKIKILEDDKKNFKPHIVIEHKPIMIKYCNPFPDIKLPPYLFLLSYEKQLRIIKNIIEKYKLKWYDNFRLQYITGYVYRRTYDESIKFDVDGELYNIIIEFDDKDFKI